MKYEDKLIKKAIDIKEKTVDSEIQNIIGELLEAYNSMYEEALHLQTSLNSAVNIYEKYEKCNRERISVKREFRRLQLSYKEIEAQLKKYQEHVILNF